MDSEIESLKVNLRELERRLRIIEDRFDTRNTVLWRRIIFRLDGWPSWINVVDKPQWRPWRKWWIS